MRRIMALAVLGTTLALATSAALGEEQRDALRSAGAIPVVIAAPAGSRVPAGLDSSDVTMPFWQTQLEVGNDGGGGGQQR